MLTAARVVAAILMAIVAYVTSEQIKGVMDPNTGFGRFSEVSALIGLLCGYIVLGSRTGRGWVAGFNNGITTAVVVVFWGLFFQSGYFMIMNALKQRYRDFGHAFSDMLDKAVEYALVLADTNVILTLLIGSVLAGILSEMAARAWR